jgi:hypothetical protein
MRWYRDRRSFGGLLALFALGLQLVVSFAHIHPEGIRPSSDFSLSGVASLARLSAEAPYAPAAPSDQGSGGLPHHDCAICISIGLLGSALNAQTPVLAVPAVLRFGPAPLVGEFQLSLVRYLSFRTRAPPVV